MASWLAFLGERRAFMRYYVTADIHGFYMEFQAALQLTEFDPIRHTSCGIPNLREREQNLARMPTSAHIMLRVSWRWMPAQHTAGE